MPRYLFDSDHLTLYHHHHPPLVQRLASQPPNAVGVCPVAVEEALRGRLAVLARPPKGITRVRAYALLIETVRLVTGLPIVPFDQAADNQFQQLLASRLHVGSRDLKIAAVALVNNLTVLTRNRRDFGRIPGLQLDDWSR